LRLFARLAQWLRLGALLQSRMLGQRRLSKGVLPLPLHPNGLLLEAILGTMAFRHILVAYDGSPPAHRALELAVELGLPFHASITLVHVIHIPVPPPETAFAGWGELLETEQREGQRLVAEAARSMRERGVTVQTRLVQGVPAEKLAEAATGADVDLLVTGTTGKRALARIFLGSVTTRLLHICPKPILVVP
jgi:nucleotide-binding universal stress UspA family protein